MINPADINLSALPWLPLEARSAFPRQPAIYFAIDSQQTIQYIGISTDPKTRWVKHHRYDQLNAIGQIRIAYLFVEDSALLKPIETALIEWFDPPLNVMGRQICESVGDRAVDAEAPLATQKPKLSVYIEPEDLEWFQVYCKRQQRSASAQLVFMIKQLKQADRP